MFSWGLLRIKHKNMNVYPHQQLKLYQGGECHLVTGIQSKQLNLHQGGTHLVTGIQSS